MTFKPLSRRQQIVVQELENEILIYDLTINKAYCLNQTAGLVFQNCDGRKSISEIGRILSRKLNSPVNDELIRLTIDKLKRNNLLENSDEIVPEFNELSRRQLIGRAALGGMTALPVITSLVAPRAVQAQSGVILAVCPGGTCTCTVINRGLAISCASLGGTDNCASPCVCIVNPGGNTGMCVG